ncbi:MAG: hypothetical protein HYW27_02760 [Candidatus Aenigmarchaeota archaeon]|nr:hypothetical protein [Candidatus Aenigmarchaeota archaeon]
MGGVGTGYFIAGGDIFRMEIDEVRYVHELVRTHPGEMTRCDITNALAAYTGSSNIAMRHYVWKAQAAGLISPARRFVDGQSQRVFYPVQ